MKITVNKDFTPARQKETVKNAIALFKEYFEEQDLVRMYAEEFSSDCYGEVIKCDVQAFPVCDWSDECSFKVDLILRNSIRFYTLHFYINESEGVFSIDNRSFLHEMCEYQLV